MTRSAPFFRPLFAAAGLLALTLVLALSTGARAAARTVECQHPTTTGEEATHLRHVSAHTACRVVRSLARYLRTAKHVRALYGCHRKDANSAGFPYLRRHHYGTWAIRISSSGLRFHRGTSSFDVSGTDFPLNCT